MKKLRLELEQLAVDAFETGEAGGVGTVRARAESDPDVCPQPIGDGEVAITVTWWQTCPATCQGDTCYISCVTACSCRTQPCDTCA